MFTGIVEELGEVVDLEVGSESAVIRIKGPLVTSDTVHGESVSVNGVCLTVVTCDGEVFSVDVMAETLNRSSLGELQVGSAVNLERAISLESRLGGHIVQGHVDGTGRIAARTPGQRWELVRICAPPELMRYVVLKGSITVDGVSLTVSAVHEDGFSVSLIPTTLDVTTLGTRAVGERVNLEVDVLAKYVERLLSFPRSAGQPGRPA
ncbi:riboflavin synthase [Gephyromycinifex aptenodytis]|uniref:riboflavin synthase n=1 Tax=Gephyromycinifex aptenodytis TaxID=2716227 RepID=UPI0014456745|nr:riboflavin synthase [Gephyromycinifex aptenodytis]